MDHNSSIFLLSNVTNSHLFATQLIIISTFGLNMELQLTVDKLIK